MAELADYDLASVPEIIIPGPFVVFQGIPGNGIANTIDSHPELEQSEEADIGEVEEDEEDDEEDEDYHHLVNDEVLVYEASPATENFHIYNNPTALLPSLSNLSVQPLQTTTSGQTINRNNDTFLVIEESKEQQQPYQKSKTTPQQQDASSVRRGAIHDQDLIENWNVKRHTKQQNDRNEWLENQNANKFKSKDLTAEYRWWINPDGRLKVFRDIPIKSEISGFVDCQTIGTLSPGATVVGTKLFCMHTSTFKAIKMIINPTTGNYLPGRHGWLQILKIESPIEGMTVLSIDGYPYLGPGLPALYIEPNTWFWRVTCGNGAFLREGIELGNKYLTTIIYGSVIQVTRKMINNEGLSRIHVHTTVSKEDNNIKEKAAPQSLQGWISENLNPQSGQQGPIARPLPFPVPALFKVVIGVGATIRCGVELSSVQIGHAPMWTTLSIDGRAFSEHPVDKCVERLRLAGNGGWISLRICGHPPNNKPIVELIGIDGSFDPDSPGKFHLEAQRLVLQEQTESPLPADLLDLDDPRSGDLSEIGSSSSSSTDNNTTSHRNNKRKPKKVTRHRPPPERKTDVCLICLTELRNATIIHEETGHICCCLQCARILMHNGDRCPVCRLPIDKVIQHFYA